MGCIHAADDNMTLSSEVNDSQSYKVNYLSYEDSNSSYDPILVGTYVKGSYSNGEYTSGDIDYQVKVYDVLRYDGIKYYQHRYGVPVKLKIYSGSSFKYYSSQVSDNGMASFKLPKLSLGNHKIDIYVDGKYNTSSSLKVVKSTTKFMRLHKL